MNHYLAYVLGTVCVFTPVSVAYWADENPELSQQVLEVLSLPLKATYEFLLPSEEEEFRHPMGLSYVELREFNHCESKERCLR